MYKVTRSCIKKKTAGLLTGIFLIVNLLISGSIFVSCKNETSNLGPLTEFIYYSEENDLPVDYLEIINDKINIRYRARPAYSGGTVYLDHAFDEDGNFLPFYRMDSFEISSVFHEGFHAYVDLHIRSGESSAREQENFKKILEDALDYYILTADGKKIVWGNYRKQSSEEAMAIQITNLIKYKIVYEKVAEKTARNYIYDFIDRDQMESELLVINRQWNEVYNGQKSRGYYNKSFLRWKFPHIIDVGKQISEQENNFVLKYILPGLNNNIAKPPITEFIKDSKAYGLPYDYLIDVNKNYFWEEGFYPGVFSEMSPEEVSKVYVEAFLLYWEKVLSREASSSIIENETFTKLIKITEKWYSDQVDDRNKTKLITKNAAAVYIERIINEKVIWQNNLNSHLSRQSSFDTQEFEISWRKVIEGNDVYGYIFENGEATFSEKPMSIDEKEFILNFILKDIIYSFGSLITVEPDHAEGEINAEFEIFSDLNS
ncbi:hypothetical protein ACFLQQ_03200 [Actinomycetota bacterium]